MRKIIISLLALSAFFVMFVIGSIWMNNRPIEPLSKNEIRLSLNKAINWLVNNQESVTKDTNAILWWMIYESSLLTSDERLTSLSKRYIDNYEKSFPQAVWKYLFDKSFYKPYNRAELANFPDYNYLFVYGLTCDNKLLTLKTVQDQMETGFCWKNYPISTRCVTHQLMGFMFMRRNGCINPEHQEKIKQLQFFIESQLTYDFRVVDPYIQRVLMLADSGAKHRIKPIWLKRIVDAQLPDGGWGDFYSLIRLDEDRQISSVAYKLTVEKPASNWHTTAQGIFLMAEMLSDNQ